MYINDVHILIYVIIGLIGGGLGFIAGWCNERMPEYKKIFSKEIFLEYKTRLKPNFWLIAINAVIYILLLYRFGIKQIPIANLPLVSYLILTPMLLSVFCIDYKLTIIPNRLNLTMFEIGLIFVFAYGIINFNLAIDGLLGMLIGGGIFLLISLIGAAIAGKEAMGLGDVKLMGALGLFFGVTNIIVITVLAFLISAIISLIIIIVKRKTDQYIPFGPFIVISTFVVMLLPNQLLIDMLLKIFTLGMY